MPDEQREKLEREQLERARANPITSGRSCGTCTLCCKVLKISELNKPQGVWCPHCKPGSGCMVHSERPGECRNFFCGYLTSPDLGEEWKPSRSKLVIAPELNGNRIAVHVDPQRPDAWKQEPYYSTLKQLAKQAVPNRGQVLVWVGTRVYIVFPDRDVDLGIVGKDELVVWGERMTPLGIRSEAFKIHKDDPRAENLAVQKWGDADLAEQTDGVSPRAEIEGA